MMSNLSSIYNTFSRQVQSLGKSAAVHTLHSIKSMPLRKETPGNLVTCPATPQMVKYLHSGGQVTSILLLVWCLLPWAEKSYPWEGRSYKDMPAISYAFPPLTWNHLCESSHLCILMLPNPEKPHVRQLRKLNAPLTSGLEGSMERQSHMCSQNT